MCSKIGMEGARDTPTTTITPIRLHLECWWPAPRVCVWKLEAGCHQTSRANHFAGSKTDNEAVCVKRQMVV